MTLSDGGQTAASSIQLAPGQKGSAPRVGRYRWVIVIFLFFATALNYVDRQTLSVLQSTIADFFKTDRSLDWVLPYSQYFYHSTFKVANADWAIKYAFIIFCFQTAYAIGYVLFGALIDKLGAKLGYSIAVVLWTAAHVACAMVTSLVGFSYMLFVLGLGQSGNFPAALKAVAEWFPQRERALANGLFNAGSNIGAIFTPLVVPIITLYFGWRMAFVATGSLSVIWLIFWIWIYKRPKENKRVSAAELAFIESDQPPKENKLSWLKVMGVKETWAFAIGKFLTDPIWWFYLFWLPGFLHEQYKLDLNHFGPPLAVIYIISDLGSIAGGWMSSTMIKRGISVNAARKLTMLLCAFCVMPVMFTVHVSSVWAAVAIIGLATAAHQAFSANLYTLPSDLFPRAAVGSVSGVGGTAGAVGGMLFTIFIGLVKAATGTYTMVFIIAGTIYLVSLVVIHWLTPRLAPANIN